MSNFERVHLLDGNRLYRLVKGQTKKFPLATSPSPGDLNHAVQLA